jgi:hypothetical protein
MCFSQNKNDDGKYADKIQEALEREAAVMVRIAELEKELAMPDQGKLDQIDQLVKELDEVAEMANEVRAGRTSAKKLKKKHLEVT